MPSMCLGHSAGVPCCFRRDGTGLPARPTTGKTRCSFCDREYMSSLCVDRKYNTVVQALKSFPPEIRQKGMEYIPEDQKAYFEQ